MTLGRSVGPAFYKRGEKYGEQEVRARAAAQRRCKDCGGSGLCEHGRVRSLCKACGGGGHVTVLEATEVEEFDREDQDDWVPTVQARLVVRPRGGGKRKRPWRKVIESAALSRCLYTGAC